MHTCDMAHSYVWHSWCMCMMPHSCVTCDIHYRPASKTAWKGHMTHASFIYDMTHTHLSFPRCITRDMSHLYVTWLNHMWCDSSITDRPHISHMWHAPSWMIWLIHTWHDSFIRDMMVVRDVTYPLQTSLSSFICDMTHSYGIRLIHMWRDMTHSYTWRDLCITDQPHVWIVLARIWMSLVTNMIGACHTYERVISRVWMSHVTHGHESCRTHESPHTRLSLVKRVMSHTWMSRGHESLVNESQHTLEPVMIHTWLSYPWCQTYEWVTCKWVTAHTRTSHDTHMTQLSMMSNIWMSHL